MYHTFAVILQPGANITSIWLHSYATILCRICMALLCPVPYLFSRILV